MIANNMISHKYDIESQRIRETHFLNPKEQARELAMHFAGTNGVVGDYLEFGIFRGDGLAQAVLTHDYVSLKIESFMWLKNQTRPNASDLRWAQHVSSFGQMRFIGFDSFSGLSEPTEPCEKGYFCAGDMACSREEFDQNVSAFGVEHRIEVVPGWFRDTLNSGTAENLKLTKAAIVHIDCDLYEPSVQALDFVTPLLTDGTVIILDDWFLFKGRPDCGQQLAFNDWVIKNNLDFSELIKNGVAAFIIHL